MNGLDGKDVRVSMRDLLYFILRKWRFVVILGFGCAFLFAACRELKLLSMIRSDDYLKKAEKRYEDGLKDWESETRKLDREIAGLEKELEGKRRDQDQSPLMDMDPYDSWVSSADVYVSSTSGASASLLASIYQNALQNGSISQRLAGRLHLDEKYIGEMIRINSQEYTTEYPDKEQTEMLTDQVLLHIGLISDNEENARDLMDNILAELEKLSVELNDRGQPGMLNHLAILNYVCANRTVDELEIYQNSIRDAVESLSEELDACIEEKEDLEEPVYKQPWSREERFLSGVKYFLLGGFAGGILSLVVLLFACLYSDRILSPDELRKHTGLRVYAVEEPKSEKKRLCAGIDHFIHGHELRSELVSGQMLQKWLELDHETRRYVTWGEHDKGFLNDIIPDIKNKTVLDMDEMDSWRSLLPVAGQEVEVEETQYILFADREKTTYQELERKLDMIRWLKGRAVMCVLYI